MRRVLLLVLLVPVAGASPLLVGVVADLPGSAPGEAVAVWSDHPIDLGGWALSDGEDTWTFPAGAMLAADQEAWVVADRLAWAAHDGPDAAWTFDLRLGNDGDQVVLLDPAGRVVDGVSYGDATTPAQAGSVAYTDDTLVLRRDRVQGRPVDTDRADDWRTPRVHRIGENTLDAPTFDVDRITAYASPDSSHRVLTDLLAGATGRIALHVYDLRAPALVDALVAAKSHHPGLDLQVLLEDAPVGLDAQTRSERAEALHRVQDAGGSAWLAGSERYRYHHLKVLVVDDAVAVQSENWVPSGVPEDPTWGNRGWGVVLQDAEAADWFWDVLAADRAAWDTEPFDLDAYDPFHAAPPRLPARSGPLEPVPAQTFDGPFSVRPVISPDHTADPRSDPVAAVIAAAQDTVRIQQLDLSLAGDNVLGWSAPDALTTAAAEAAWRGVDVRVQAAAPFSADDTGNTDALAWLAGRGVRTAVMDRPGIATLHNKGVVVDDRWVVVGSMNGNHHSRSMNREAAVLMDAPPVAAYFAGLFDADLAGADGRDWSRPLDDLQSIPTTPLPTLLVALAVMTTSRCSRSSPGSHSP